MIPQLARRLLDPVVAGGAPLPGFPAAPQPSDAATAVLQADQLDLVLYMEQAWDSAKAWNASIPQSGKARTALFQMGAFAGYAPVTGFAWDHLMYSYILENTRMVQIMGRVVREFRRGESLGIPSIDTQRWLDVTETLVYGADYPMSAWLSTSRLRPDPEAVRRNAYWRMFGMDLAFGTEDNKPYGYDKAVAANTSFVRLFEELLYEVWQAIMNVKNFSGVNSSDQDRIFAITEELKFILRSRRQSAQLAREELAAATALSWLYFTLDTNSAIVEDLRATATNASDRLKLIGAKVGLPAHSKTSSLISMADDLSLLLRTIESNLIPSPDFAYVLYKDGFFPGSTTVKLLGSTSRRVITEWSAATGRDLKSRKAPAEVRPRTGQPSLTR
ncbi:hypothetical protein ACFDTO_11295 [Microbacteriaceae bacterium 4G12]